MTPAARRAALALGWVLLAPPAGAALPGADRVEAALANANRAARRATALELGVELVRDGSGSEVVGAGTLQLHPSGLARLELRGAGGLVERHLLLGSAHHASRNGAPLASPQPFLAPLQLLQASSGAAVGSALRQLGAAQGEIALGRTPDSDCYVLGGREPGPDRPPPRRAALWVDVASFEPARIDRADGVRFELGPPGAFGEIRFPAWIRVEAPGEPPVRLVVRSAARSGVDASGFRREWLSAAPPPPAPAPRTPPGPPAGARGNP
jgi:hypothetical protein